MEALGAGKALKEILNALGDQGDVHLAVKTQLMREYIAAQVALSTSNNTKVIITSGRADEDLLAKASTIFGKIETEVK